MTLNEAITIMKEDMKYATGESKKAYKKIIEYILKEIDYEKDVKKNYVSKVHINEIFDSMEQYIQSSLEEFKEMIKKGN